MAPISYPMANTTNIIRKSIFTFLQNLHHFTSSPSLLLLLLPFSTVSLLSHPLTSSSPLLPLLHRRLAALSLAAGIPPASELSPILNLKLSQTLLSSLLLLPFTLSSLLLAKAAILAALHPRKTTPVFPRLLATQLCNYAFILAANAASFSLLVLLFNSFTLLGLASPKLLLLVSATGTITYSIILANAYIACSLSLIISGTESVTGFSSIIRACSVMRGRSATALSLAVPMNMAMAGVEALFQYRVVRAYDRAMAFDLAMVMEAMLIAYLYGMLLVLDTVVGFVFLKSCKQECRADDQEGLCRIEIERRDRDQKGFGEVCWRINVNN